MDNNNHTTISVIASLCGAGITLLTQQKTVTPRDAVLSFLSGASLSVFVMPAVFEWLGVEHGARTYAAAMFCGLLGARATQALLRVADRRIERVIDTGIDTVAPWARDDKQPEKATDTEADTDNGRVD